MKTQKNLNQFDLLKRSLTNPFLDLHLSTIITLAFKISKGFCQNLTNAGVNYL